MMDGRLLLLILSAILNTVAACTHAWFMFHPEGYYGLWSVVFCDVLQCHFIPAFFMNEPVWYHIVQILAVFSWMGLLTTMWMMLNPFRLPKCLHFSLHHHRQLVAPVACLLSAFSMMFCLTLFYISLDMDYSVNRRPQISWAVPLIIVACFFQFLVGLSLLVRPISAGQKYVLEVKPKERHFFRL